MNNRELLKLCTKKEIKEIINRLENDTKFKESINAVADEPEANIIGKKYYVKGQKECFAVKFVFKAYAHAKYPEYQVIYDNSCGSGEVQAQFKKININVYPLASR